MSNRPDPSIIDTRILDAEAAAAALDIDVIFETLPSVVAEAVRLDVAARSPGGVRSAEHDQALGMCFALRSKLDMEPLTTDGREGVRWALVHALAALGYEPTLLLRWTRADVRREPRVSNPSNEYIVIPTITGIESIEALSRDPNFGRDVPPPHTS